MACRHRFGRHPFYNALPPSSIEGKIFAIPCFLRIFATAKTWIMNIYIAWTFNRFQSKLNWIETNEKFSPTTKKNMEDIAQIIAARLWDILCQLLCLLPRVLHICESLFSSSIEQFSFKCWFAVHLKWIQIKTRMYPILNGMRSSSFFHIRNSFFKNSTVRGEFKSDFF